MRDRELKARKRPRQGRSRATVEFVLEAAAQVFAERGYAGATTNVIAERAGVSIGSVYQYYPNKDAILLALAERHVAESAAATEAVAARLRAAEPGVEDVVRALVTAVVELNGDGRDQRYRVLYEEAPRTAELRAVLDRLRARIVEEVTYHLRRLGLGGGDPELVAIVAVHAVDALVHQVVLDPPRPVEACVEEVTACALRYVRGD